MQILRVNTCKIFQSAWYVSSETLPIRISPVVPNNVTEEENRTCQPKYEPPDKIEANLKKKHILLFDLFMSHSLGIYNNI